MLGYMFVCMISDIVHLLCFEGEGGGGGVVLLDALVVGPLVVV